ncbi:MAG TPA: GNAT family N-acetyltransferase [Acidimicrobiia bacterium]
MTITFSRLPDAPFDEVLRLINEPRNTRHMPLFSPFTPDEAKGWIAGKDAQWDEFGYGPWAFYIDDRFVGWGGFQREDDGADFGLVLFPEFWGHGLEITRVALGKGFNEFEFDEVYALLPLTRNADRAMAKVGFETLGVIDYDGIPFRQYRLGREQWELLQAPE